MTMIRKSPGTRGGRRPHLVAVIRECFRRERRSLWSSRGRGSLGALLLVDDGSSRKEKTSGLAVMRGRVPLHAHDRFRVGSITKSFVAVVVLQLVGERQLSLRDTVERWLPGVVPGGGRITLRELLAHRSGLVDYADDVAVVRRTVAQPRRLWTPRELVAVALAEGRVAPPGNGPLPDRSFRP